MTLPAPPTLRATSLCACVLLLAACASPGPERAAAPTLGPASLGLAATPTAAVAAQWWQQLGNADLDHWVALALQGNPSVAAARVGEKPQPHAAAEAMPTRQPTKVITKKPGRAMRSPSAALWAKRETIVSKKNSLCGMARGGAGPPCSFYGKCASSALNTCADSYHF